MDPSYNNNFGGTPQATQGGIFSGNTPPNSRMSASRSTPISGGSGDILLEKTKKSPKKGLVIGLIIAFVILIAAGVAAILLTSGQGGSQQTVARTQSEKLNRYANYLFYGSNSTAPLDIDYDNDEIYAVDTAIENTDTDYFTTLSQYWTDYLQFITKDESLMNDGRILGESELQTQLMDFVTKFVTAQSISEDDFVTIYAEQKSDGTNNLINERYSVFDDNNNELVKQYVTAQKNRAAAIIAILQQLDSEGCIVDGEIDQECYDNVPIDAQLNTNFIEYVNAPELDYSDILIQDLKQNCLDMLIDYSDAETDQSTETENATDADAGSDTTLENEGQGAEDAEEQI